jgi:hypothetical protein
MHASAPDFGSAVTAPQRVHAQREGITLTLLTGLFAAGEVDSVVVGDRFRHVVVASWRDYVRRKQLGLERDPIEKKAAAEAYRASIKPASTAAALRALAGKPKPGRPRGSGKKHGKSSPTVHTPAQRELALPRAAPRSAPEVVSKGEAEPI